MSSVVGNRRAAGASAQTATEEVDRLPQPRSAHVDAWERNTMAALAGSTRGDVRLDYH